MQDLPGTALHVFQVIVGVLVFEAADGGYNCDEYSGGDDGNDYDVIEEFRIVIIRLNVVNTIMMMNNIMLILFFIFFYE